MGVQGRGFLLGSGKWSWVGEQGSGVVQIVVERSCIDSREVCCVDIRSGIVLRE
jgi:hypothetical protein